MGIQGLLPLLKSIQQPISISELAGSTVGVDVYCWLHKGAYGCALELAQGNDSNLYVLLNLGVEGFSHRAVVLQRIVFIDNCVFAIGTSTM